MSKLREALEAWQSKYSDAPSARPRSIYAICPPPIRHGQDQYRCQKCGMVWDTNEDKPDCNRKGE